MKIVRSNTIDPSSLASEENNEYSFFKSRAKFHSNEVPPFGVYIDQKAWAAFLEHGHQVYAQQRHEAQGIFLGKYFTDEQGEFVVATHYAAGTGESTHSYVEMSEECLAQISQKCKEENLLMLIWIHTHPNFGVFYSGTDINCLKTNFFMPYQTGIVVDIIRKLHKGFKVREKNVTEFENY
ncbi:MAG TPA: hypothetical protein DIU20_08720, partial [Cryomorphaceae bacterium]|nr:hypothetical protein [Cryomorphaceae bacterium]